MTDTPTLTVQIQHWQTQIAALDPAARADALQHVSDHLGAAYAAAEARADSETMNAISIAWEQTQQIATHADSAHAVASGSTAAAASLAAEHAALAKEHEELIEAIDNYDWDHPRIASLLEIAEEWYDSESETFYDDVHYTLTDALGMSNAEAVVFINSIKEGSWGIAPDDCDLMIAYFIKLKLRLEGHPAADFIDDDDDGSDE